MLAVLGVVVRSCVVAGLVLLLEKWMAGFFRLSRTRFRAGRMARAILNMAVVLTLPLACGGTGLAQTCLVTSNTDGGTGTLRSCLANPGSYTIINFSSSVTGTITLTSALPAISTNLTIQGPGAGSLTISGAKAYTVFSISEGVVNVSGLTIANGYTTGYGGGILNYGTLTVSNSSFRGNTSDAGGAIFSYGTLAVSNSAFAGNSASSSSGGLGYGGAIASAAQMTLSNNTFSGNSGTEGGAIYNQAGSTISNNTFSGNTTSGFGGAIYNNYTTTGSASTVNNNIFVGNSALLGGGVANTGTTNASTTNASYNVFYNNLAGGSESDCFGCTINSNATDANPQLAPLGNYGGPTQTMLPLPVSPAICAGSASLVPSGVTTDQRGFPLDTACVDAGAVQTNYLMVNTAADSNDGSCTSTTCSLRDAIAAANSGTMGDIDFSPTVFTATPPATVPSIVLGSSLPLLSGPINIVGPAASTPPTITSVTVSGNNSSTVGSIFTVDSGAQVFLYGLTTANGYANNGGGILNNGTLTITSSDFTGNSTPGSLGGAIDNSGTLTVADSTFSANSCGNLGGSGGAIYNSGTLAVTNSTFTGNSSGNTGGVGGALYDTGTLTVSNSTFVGNSSANGGGVAVFGGTATIANSIFAHNTSPSNGAAVFTPSFVVDAYNNLFFENIDSGTASESDCFNCTINSGSVTGDPMLAALGNYGGPTQTLLPLPGSAAICAGLKALALDANGSPLITDQRGFPLGASNSTYCSATTLDAGAVQTDYTSIQFTNIPGGGAYPAIQNAVPNPLPIVSVTENSHNIDSVPVTLTDASHTVTGLGPATTVASTGATFSSLQDSAIEDTTLSATLLITSTYSLTTGTTAEFDVTTSTLTLTPTILPSPTVGVAYSQTLSASGGSGTYTYSISAGALPAGLTLNSTTGVISGTATAAATFNFTVTATDSNNSSLTGSRAYSLTVVAPTITLTPTTLLLPTVGVAYSQTLNANGGMAPYTYSISAGALPAGLTLNSTTGVISGTATAAATFNFTVTAKDSNNFTAAQAYSFTIAAPTITLTPTTLLLPTVGVAYSQTLNASGGTSPYSYSISAGALPTGLTLSSTTGVISGTAAAAATFNFAVTAKDRDSFTATQSYSITVSRQASQTTVSASPSVASPAQTITLTATVSATVAGTSVVPSGTVTFLESGTQLGTATLSGGTAQLLLPSLPTGTSSVITATYAGDGNFLASTSSNSATVVVSVFDFTFATTGTSAYTAAPGAAATYNFDVMPLYGSYPGPVTFGVTGLPAGAAATFTPSTVAAGGGATPVVMAVQTASAVACNRNSSGLFGRSITLALLFLPVAAKRRVREKLKGRMLLLVLLMAGLTATVTGCGSQNGFLLQSPQTYMLTVTATSGTLQHSQTVTLIVQ
jgi:CSLREA domain-containing protein